MLKKISNILSVFVGLTIINVWLFRASKSTSFRGGNAIMMLVAVYMHMSVGDELIKSLPASSLLISSLIIAYSANKNK